MVEKIEWGIFMEIEQIWNYIVEKYEEDYNALESVLQTSWEQYFSELFDYSRLFGEVDAHRSKQIGSSQRAVPDIIIKVNGEDLFIVELKQYNAKFSEEMEDQLKSYMDLLHIKVGILVCQKIYVYIYDFSQSKFKRTEISFRKDDVNGIKFINLFKKANFSIESIEQFIDSEKKFKNNVNEIKTKITERTVRELLESFFIESYLKEEVECALSDILIEVKSKQQTPQQPSVLNDRKKKVGGGGDNGMDYSRYLFEGQSYGKSRLVLAVVKAYVRDNSPLSSTFLKTVFEDKIQGSTGVIATPDVARGKRQDYQKRYFVKEPINTRDGVVWVCTQWGIGNIDKFITKASSLGYSIIKE